MIGISIGYEDWFISKTPINLSLVFALVVLCFPKLDRTFWLAFAGFFMGGMMVEWIGVHYGFLFGGYSYGDNLGPKLLGVPYFIGLNWALLTIISGVIATHLVSKKWLQIIIGAGLMVFLDFFLEDAAPRFDYWTFDGGLAPIRNYIAWFGISVLFHFIYQSLKIEGDTKLSYHLYLAQLVFFAWFYGFYHL
jgi:putative membrane protein